MKSLYVTIILYLFTSTTVSAVTTCSDALSVQGEANAILHIHAQKRAQKAIEETLEKKIINPYMTAFGHEGTPETMSKLIRNILVRNKINSFTLRLLPLLLI